jgi:hypothetical protein
MDLRFNIIKSDTAKLLEESKLTEVDLGSDFFKI